MGRMSDCVTQWRENREERTETEREREREGKGRRSEREKRGERENDRQHISLEERPPIEKLLYNNTAHIKTADA